MATNLTKVHFGNWVKQVVSPGGGGTGNLTLGEVLQHPTVAQEVGTNKSFYYVIRATNNSPIEMGVAVMINATTMRRDHIVGQMIDGVYTVATEGAALTALNIAEGAFIFTAPTKEMLYALVNEMSYQSYSWDGVITERQVSPQIKHNRVEVGPLLFTLSFDDAFKPVVGSKYEITVSAWAKVNPVGGQPKIRFDGAVFHFGNGCAIPDYPVLTAETVEVLPTGLVNGSTYTTVKGVRTLTSLVDDSDNPLVRDVNFSFDELTGLLTILNIGSFVQPLTLTYDNLNESLFRLTTWDGGQSYVVENVSEYLNPVDLGTVTPDAFGDVYLDIRHKFTIGELTGTTTTYDIAGVTVDVPVLEPAHFTFVNTGSATKTVTFDTNILSISGSTLSQVTLPVGYKVDFDVRRNLLNDGLSYEVKVGDVNYNQTASGLATTWNPSDANINLDFSNSNKTVTFDTIVGSTAIVYTARAFGAKTSGKFRIACVVPTLPNGSSSSVTSTLILGIADYTLGLTSDVGATLTSAGVRIHSPSNGIRSTGKMNNNTLTTYSSQPLINPGLILGVLIDLDSGKVWFTVDSIVLSGGDPVTGTLPDFTLPDTVLLPAITLRAIDGGAGSPVIAVVTLLNEIEDPYSATFNTFQNWTA